MLCIYFTYIVHILYIYCAYIVHIFYICSTYVVDILYIYCAYIIHILCIYCTYILRILCVCCTYSVFPILLPSLDIVSVYYRYILLKFMYYGTHTSKDINVFNEIFGTIQTVPIKVAEPRGSTFFYALIFCAIWPSGGSKIIVFAPKIIFPRNLKCLR